MKIDNWKICHWPILAVYLKDFFCREFCKLKLRPLLFLSSWFNAFFHLKSQSQRTLRLLFEDCRFIYVYSLMKSAFLRSKPQNTRPLWSASLTCVGRLWRSRHNNRRYSYSMTCKWVAGYSEVAPIHDCL